MAKKLSKDERGAIRRSGYLMEQRLVPLVQNLGYYTVPNYGFTDLETGESREMDIYAMGAESITKFGKREFIFPVLLIECKNLRSPLVFFTQQEARTRHLIGDAQLSGLPKEVITAEGRQDILDFLNFEAFHHYYRTGRIASQFCVVHKKGNSSFASHDLEGVGNLYHKMVLPMIKAVQFEIEEHEDSWRYEPGREVINLQFYYPVIITKGDLYECFVGGKRPKYRRVHRINFIRRYHSEKIKGEYRIDVVTETGFRRLLNTIEQEIHNIAARIKRKKELLRRSANSIARERARKSRGRKKHKVVNV